MEELEEIIEDIEQNKENTRYMEEIKKEYPYLLGILKNRNMRFNPDRNTVRKIGKALMKLTDNHCPCVMKRTESSICPCQEMREEDKCICGLYVKK